MNKLRIILRTLFAFGMLLIGADSRTADKVVLLNKWVRFLFPSAVLKDSWFDLALHSFANDVTFMVCVLSFYLSMIISVMASHSLCRSSYWFKLLNLITFVPTALSASLVS